MHNYIFSNIIATEQYCYNSFIITNKQSGKKKYSVKHKKIQMNNNTMSLLVKREVFKLNQT